MRFTAKQICPIIRDFPDHLDYEEWIIHDSKLRIAMELVDKLQFEIYRDDDGNPVVCLDVEIQSSKEYRERIMKLLGYDKSDTQ